MVEKGVIKDTNSSIIKPYVDWLLCYGLVAAGHIPSETGDSLCAAIENFDDTRKFISDFENDIFSNISIDGKNPMNLKEYLTEQGLYTIFDTSEDVQKLLEKMLGIDISNKNKPGINIEHVSRLHNGLNFDGKDSRIDEHFAKTISKQIISFSGNGKITNRIKEDMGLNGKPKFDSKEFAAIYNAIQLSKLSLLDAESLNKLTKKLGYKVNQNLYNSDSNNHILTHWLRSIDGNHQWLPLSPRDVKVKSSYDKNWDTSADYFYNIYPKNHRSPSKIQLSKISGFLPKFRENAGMRLYGDENLRTKLFSRLFKGPLNHSLFCSGHKFINVIDVNHNYKPTANDPFPNLSN